MWTKTEERSILHKDKLVHICLYCSGLCWELHWPRLRECLQPETVGLPSNNLHLYLCTSTSVSTEPAHIRHTTICPWNSIRFSFTTAIMETPLKELAPAHSFKTRPLRHYLQLKQSMHLKRAQCGDSGSSLQLVTVPRNTDGWAQCC